jgi:hypothetical protein
LAEKDVVLNNPSEQLALILSAWSGCVGLGSIGSAEGESSPAAPPSRPEPQSRRAQITIESERQEAERQARKILDDKAVVAVEETKEALRYIADGKTREAIEAIEQTQGKLTLLLTRNPASVLLPVDLQARVIDTAPRDSEQILEIAKDASLAFDEENFPDARTLLHALMSEVRVRTYNLPLATYPKALKDASYFLQQGKSDEAASLLSAALNTLVALDEVTPIPLIVARDAINHAQTQLNSPAEALRLLETARNEFLRARLLGYASRAPEYAWLNEEISKLEKQLKNKEESGRIFVALKQKLGAFLKLNRKQRRVETHRKDET